MRKCGFNAHRHQGSASEGFALLNRQEKDVAKSSFVFIRTSTFVSALLVPCVQLIEQGTKAFLNLPPRPDPLAVRLTVNMLLKNASCPRSPNFRKTERVMVDGKARPVKARKLLEAATLMAVQYLFDASDCASRNANEADPTCRLLHRYDAYMQAGGSSKAFAEEAQRADIPESPVFPGESEDAGESGGTTESPGAEMEKESSSEESSSGQPPMAFFENTDLSGQDQDKTLPTEKNEAAGDEETDYTSGDASTLSNSSEDEAAESPGRNESIFLYAQSASNTAMAVARLSTPVVAPENNHDKKITACHCVPDILFR